MTQTAQNQVSMHLKKHMQTIANSAIIIVTRPIILK